MARDVSPLANVTVAQNELTPIPKIPGALTSHVIYSSSSVASSHIPYNAIHMPRGRINELDDSVMSTMSSSSSMFQVHVDPKVSSTNPLISSNSAPNLLQPPPTQSVSPVYTQANGRHNYNPFNPNSNPGNSTQNLLMSSANFYPE